MSRSHRKSNSSADRSAEVLNKEIRMDGVGEDSLIKSLLNGEFDNLPDKQALEFGVLLRKLISGEEYISQNLDKITQSVNMLADRIDKMEKAKEAYESNQQAFLEEARERGEAVRNDDPAYKNKLLAETSKKIGQLTANARAKRAMQQQEHIRRLEMEPKETIISPGIIELVSVDGNPVPTLTSDFVRLGTLVWELKPGVPTVVPLSIANQYRDMMRARTELERRSGALELKNGIMGPKHEQNTLINEQRKIDQEFGTKNAQFPLI